MSSTAESSDRIPLASEVGSTNNQSPAPDQQEERASELTEEQMAEKEAFRTRQVVQCRDFVQSYIEGKAPGKIRYRNNVKQATDSYIFKFSPPAARGVRTRFFSQVEYNTGEANPNQAYRLVHFRPKNHSNKLWYFPILYLMNGKTKNPQRTFESLGLEPVQDSIRSLMESKGYRVQYIVRRVRPEPGQPSSTNRPEYVNYVLVSWGDESDSRPVSRQDPTPAEAVSEASSTAVEAPTSERSDQEETT